MQALWIAQHFKETVFWGNIQIWTEMGKQKLQAKKVYCLGYTKSFRGSAPCWNEPIWPEMFLVIYWLFALKLKLLPLKDHIEDLLYVYSTNTDDGWKCFRGK